MNRTHRLTWTGVVAAALSLGIAPGFSQPLHSQAQFQIAQLESPTDPNRGFFLSLPRLVDAETTFNRVAYSNATYFFTVELPEDAGSPLQQVQISQRDGSSRVRRVQYELEATQAFLGTPDDRGEALNLSETRFDRDSQTLTVRFDPPVPPGATVTLRLRPERNPLIGGVYLFGVTAYPSGTAERGQFLGYGRLHFYDTDSTPIF